MGIDHLATVLSARYASALVGWNGEITDEFRAKLRALRALCQDIVELRRGDHSGARLKIEQERLERDREKTDQEVIDEFERWAQNQEVRDLICRAWTTPEERRRRMREIFGLAPEPDEKPVSGQAQSNLVKPVFRAAMRRPLAPWQESKFNSAGEDARCLVSKMHGSLIGARAICTMAGQRSCNVQ